MSLDLLEMIAGLQGEAVFFVEDGTLKNRLIESYLEAENADAQILEFELSASVRIKREGGAGAPTFVCRLETGDFQYQVLFRVGDFVGDEIDELIDHLKPLCPILPEQAARPARNIIRKNKGCSLLNISAAAKALSLSPRTLKSLIPCSETRIGEEGGNKTIEEYYWDKELVARFASIWLKQKVGRGYNREDLSFIAASCCDNDWRWAHDCISGFLDQRKLSESQG